MVLRVANARVLVIDLRRHCYLQPVQLELTRITAITAQLSDSHLQIPVLFLYRWLMALKATVWCRVLIAQFGDYFDADLYNHVI